MQILLLRFLCSSVSGLDVTSRAGRDALRVDAGAGLRDQANPCADPAELAKCSVVDGRATTGFWCDAAEWRCDSKCAGFATHCKPRAAPGASCTVGTHHDLFGKLPEGMSACPHCCKAQLTQGASCTPCAGDHRTLTCFTANGNPLPFTCLPAPPSASSRNATVLHPAQLQNYTVDESSLARATTTPSPSGPCTPASFAACVSTADGVMLGGSASAEEACGWPAAHMACFAGCCGLGLKADVGGTVVDVDAAAKGLGAENQQRVSKSLRGVYGCSAEQARFADPCASETQTTEEAEEPKPTPGPCGQRDAAAARAKMCTGHGDARGGGGAPCECKCDAGWGGDLCDEEVEYEWEPADERDIPCPADLPCGKATTVLASCSGSDGSKWQAHDLCDGEPPSRVCDGRPCKPEKARPPAPASGVTYTWEPGSADHIVCPPCGPAVEKRASCAGSDGSEWNDEALCAGEAPSTRCPDTGMPCVSGSELTYAWELGDCPCGLSEAGELRASCTGSDGSKWHDAALCGHAPPARACPVVPCTADDPPPPHLLETFVALDGVSLAAACSVASAFRDEFEARLGAPVTLLSCLERSSLAEIRRASPSDEDSTATVLDVIVDLTGRPVENVSAVVEELQQEVAQAEAAELTLVESVARRVESEPELAAALAGANTSVADLRQAHVSSFARPVERPKLWRNASTAYSGPHGAVENHLDNTEASRESCIEEHVVQGEMKRTALMGGEACSSHTERDCAWLFERKSRGVHRAGRSSAGTFDLAGEVHLCEWRPELGRCEAGRVLVVCPEGPHALEVVGPHPAGSSLSERPRRKAKAGTPHDVEDEEADRAELEALRERGEAAARRDREERERVLAAFAGRRST